MNTFPLPSRYPSHLLLSTCSTIQTTPQPRRASALIIDGGPASSSSPNCFIELRLTPFNSSTGTKSNSAVSASSSILLPSCLPSLFQATSLRIRALPRPNTDVLIPPCLRRAIAGSDLVQHVNELENGEGLEEPGGVRAYSDNLKVNLYSLSPQQSSLSLCNIISKPLTVAGNANSSNHIASQLAQSSSEHNSSPIYPIYPSIRRPKMHYFPIVPYPNIQDIAAVG